MIHPALVNLNDSLRTKEWLFILTAWELAGQDWIPRAAVFEAAHMSDHGCSAADFTKLVVKMGLIDIKKDRLTGSNHIRLTDEAITRLQTAFKIARMASKATSVLA